MKIHYIILFILFPFICNAQDIKGKVINTKGDALTGASVYWLKAGKGTATNAEGTFSLKKSSITKDQLVISFVGYEADTISVSHKKSLEVRLTESGTLSEAIVRARRENHYISSQVAIKTEVITTSEVKKAACCDLAGCFGTQSTVQAHTSNVITNSKELRMLGLSGVYNQILVDGMPMIQALSYTYGISSYPGTLVNNIFVSKGSNSVLQGFESISGQINVITKEPDNSDKLFLNLFTNSFMEKQVNAHYAFKKNQWSNMIVVHSVQPGNKMDHDEDQFLDHPMLTRYMILNKLKYGNENKFGPHMQVSMRFVNEQRIGGQLNFDAEADKGTSNAYGQVVKYYQPEIWSKTGYRFDSDTDISLYLSGFFQNQDSWFGITHYLASQQSMNANIQFDHNYMGKHNLKAGLSMRYLKLDETISFNEIEYARNFAGNYLKNETIPGIYAENNLELFDNKLSVITGLRADYHNEFGFQFTPRTLFKYMPGKNTTIRANIGTGWRTVNLFSENINLMVSSRNIDFAEELKPEKALNYGVNFTQNFANSWLSGFVSFDAYRTEFNNQIFPDYDTSPTAVIIKNYTGESASNGFQADISTNFFKQLELKAGYSLLDVYRIHNGEHIQLPFNSKNKMYAGLSWLTRNEKFQFDLNMHWFGKQKLPNTSNLPEEYQRPDYSQTYSLMNTQISYFSKNFEIYTGCENIFNFRQEQAIISWDDPFGQYFDTSSIWGPTKGREFYLGVRFKI